MAPLQRFRIVEIGTGPVSGLAAMILADFGADVIRVEPAGGDPWRDKPSYRLWTRGKRIVELDAVDDRQRILHLVEGADGVLTTWSKDQREALGLSVESLERDNLVIGVISGFGETGPYAGYPAYEGVVAAKFGRMKGFEGVADRGGPNYAAVQVATHATAQSAATAMLAALVGREATGIAQSFDTSLLRGLLPYEMGQLSFLQLQQRGVMATPPVNRTASSFMPTLNYQPVRTKDGRWLQLGNLLPHLFANFLRAVGLDDVLTDPVYEGPPARWARDDREALRDRILEAMQTRPRDEWTERFVADGGIVSHAYQTTQDALDDPDVVTNGHVVDRDGIRQLGLVANLTETPGDVGSPALRVAADAIEPRITERRSTAVRGPKKPLAGITVVESATIIAAPLGASVLADLGARVIKVEPLTGDPFREMSRGLGSSKCNAGKDSICLDLKSFEGQRIAEELAAKADVWVHNYRIGVPEKLGIGYDDLAAVNPGLVYVSANGYGPAGPGAPRPSTHPMPGAALGGVVWQIGGLPPTEDVLDIGEIREMSRRLMRANEVNPDPNTSMVVATAAMLGLAARRAHGRGQKILVDMFGANAYANWDDFLSYDGKPERPPVDRDGLGVSPLCRLYPCAEGWVFLQIEAADEWDEFARVLELDVDMNAPGLETVLAERFQQESAADFEARLAPKGVGCVVADGALPAEFLLNDPHSTAEELVVTSPHPEWGDHLRYGPMARFGTTRGFRGPDVAGGSTRKILAELGYTPAEVENLLTDRRVNAT